MKQAGLLEKAMHEIQNNVEWRPSWGQVRIESMVTERPDWCISRQRTWGVPIAFFIHKDTQELHPKSAELIEQVAQRVEQRSEEHTSELQSRPHLVCRLLLEKKNNNSVI